MASRFFKNYDRYKITYPFGSRVIFGKKEHHTGVDLVAVAENGGAVSDYVVAFDSGEVIEAGYNSRSGYYCKIRHDETLVTLYCHFKKGTLRVKKGDKVVKGEILGYMGSTGRSTGAHLHFGISLFGEWVDPEKYFDKDLSEVNKLTVIQERKLLKRGAKGEEVKLLQTLLNFHGAKIECDSSFGPATAKALAAFQRSRGITADSVAGVVTWQELMKIAKNT
ncbi:MAG: peptidoglycan DD-metalloendopeptidase family protein [Clostridia bacterium]|nr:peptidoglycan DD-metalloendopeptidase family protein [Clostridia bacterium]MBQ3228703.1 peptidoglycan DD-metalloendopeptidase family protein [Clostridia bacterium]